MFLFYLQTLSLGTLVVPFSTIPSTIGLHRLTNIPTVKKLVFEGMLPADVSALNQLLSACLVSNKVCVDLSGLELCGPRLETVHVLSTRGAEDGFATISGLSTLRGLKKCRILGDEKFCDVCVVFDKGWGSIEFFEIFTDGRLLVKGEKEAFAQFWEKMSIFKLRYGVFPPDDLTDPHQPEIEMMLAAGRARGLDLRGHQTFVDQTHPVLGRGARCHFNIYPYN